MFFFFKQKTAYEMRISDWSSDVCSSDLVAKKVEAVAGALSERAQQTGRDAVTVAGATAQTLAGLQDLGDRGHALAATMTKIVDDEIGRASCRESVCQYVLISVVAVSLKQKTKHQTN